MQAVRYGMDRLHLVVNDSHNNFVVGYINFRNTDGYGYPVEADFSLYTLRKGGNRSSYSFEDMYLVDEDLMFDY